MCDTFVSLATTDGSVILGKNSDREPNEAHELRMLPASEQPDRVRATYIEIPQVGPTHAVLLCKPYWMWGAEMGVNEHGVSIGNEAVFTKAPREKEPGLLGMDLLRLALERAQSADEAVSVITALLAEYGQGGECGHTQHLEYDNSFIISDRTSAVVLETVGRDWAVRRVEQRASISNGLTIGTADEASEGLSGISVKDKADFLYTRFSDSAARQCRTHEGLGGQMDVFRAMSLLRDHGDVGPDWSPDRKLTGQTVCAHAGFGPIRVAQSTGSMVSHVTGDAITVWVTGTSAPCTSVFKPVTFDGGLPELRRPGQLCDDSMWWRHEILHRTILRNYPRRMAYAKARDELERSFAMDPADCFAQAEAFEQRWLDRAQTIPDARLSPSYARAWRQWDRQARVP